MVLITFIAIIQHDKFKELTDEITSIKHQTDMTNEASRWYAAENNKLREFSGNLSSNKFLFSSIKIILLAIFSEHTNFARIRDVSFATSRLE